ncbi:MAG TPA: hypothetical protein VK811_03380 [Candidatus Acidoferrum sp.]|jgi:hypothetical protein|nr:hypothetical protein [Candidatus Acidoferrum sp.]
MKMTMKVTLAMLALGASAFVLRAQDNDGPPDNGGPPPQDQDQTNNWQGQPERHHRPPPLPLLKALDVNHDGIIDSNEIANASAELLTLDKNHDGQLTQDEYLPPRPPWADSNFRPPPSPLVKALDVNGDGIIDSNEIANASAELLTLDKNHDGQLTPDEYRPHRPHHHMDGPPGGGDSSDDGPPGPPPGNGDSSDGGPPGPPPNQ